MQTMNKVANLSAIKKQNYVLMLLKIVKRHSIIFDTCLKKERNVFVRVRVVVKQFVSKLKGLILLV